MPFYRDAVTLHNCLGRLLARVEQESPEQIKTLRDARLTVRFRFTAPSTQIFFDGRRRPFHVSHDDVKARADLEAALAADTLHQVLLGHMTVIHAVGNQLIAVRGPVWKVYPLANLLEAGRQFYPEVLAEQKLLKRRRK